MGFVIVSVTKTLDNWLTEDSIISFSELAEIVEHRRDKKALKKAIKKNKKFEDSNQTKLF